MIFDYIRSDLYRYAGHTRCSAWLKHYFFNRGFNFCFWLRLASSHHCFALPARLILAYKKRKYGIYISHLTQIGYGLYIGHGGPLVVNASAILGNNVNLSQYTTIGANDTKAAVIGDNVYIGPSVCVVGHVSIGNNVTIGAGSVVTKDLPDNATAAGNYAKVLHYRDPAKYISHRWPVQGN